MKTSSAKKTLEAAIDEVVALARRVVPPKMTAAVLYGSEDLRIEEIEVPSLAPDEVLLRVRLALTDGTDLKVWKRGYHAKMIRPPAVFGHEVVGEVVAVGKRVDSKWRMGMRVVAANSAPCRTCDPCRRGQETLCENLFPLLNGAYAELLLVPERIAQTNLLPVPPGLAPEVAAMTEPLACCLHGVEVAGVERGDTVAIVGLGPIGLMLAACVADAGGRPVGVGSREERRALAPSFGVVPAEPEGADVVIEAAGTVEAWERSLALVRPGGTVLAFGGLPRDTRVELDPYRIHYEEVRLVGAFHHTPRHVRAALAFLATGAYPFERLLTHVVGLEGVAPLFDDPPRDYLKAAVRP